MVPNYVAKRSVFMVLNIWLILFFWLIIPLIIQIAKIICLKCWSIEFYDNRYVIKKGVFNKQEDQYIFTGVHSVGMYQSFAGRIFNYGNIEVDCPGRKWDIKNTEYIKNPKGLKRYLQSRIDTRGVTNVIHN